MSELKEQYKRFEEVIQDNGFCMVRCPYCPLQEKCQSCENEFEHTCEETLWHYIQTGEFLK